MKESEEKTFFLRELHPAISLGACIVGIMVWAYNTFAQLSYVKEQNATIVTLIDQRHKDALEHADMQMAHMLSVLSEIKDSVKLLEYRGFQNTKQTRP